MYESQKRSIDGLKYFIVNSFLLGGTYAWLKVSVTSESNQVIHAGKLDVVLDDE